MTQYRPAPEVETIAAKIIRDVPEHKGLAGVRVVYVFRDQAAKSKGRLVLGSARKLSGLNAFLAEPEPTGVLAEPDPLFVVEIAFDAWQKLDEAQQRALVDHELSHCVATENEDGETVLSTRGHDLEEFAGIISRHGLWKSDVAKFGSAVAEQLAFAVEEVVEFVQGLGDKADPTPPPAPVDPEEKLRDELDED